MAGADEADGAYGVVGQVLAETFIKREERGLHGFHKQPVMQARGREDLLELGDVEGGGFLAENVLAGGEGLDAEIGVGVGVGGYVDGVDVCGEEFGQGGGGLRDVEFLSEGLGFGGIASPYGLKGGVGDGG